MGQKDSSDPESTSRTLDYEPLALFQSTPLQDDSTLADCKGKRIGILIVTYNALTTLLPVLKRISRNVWRNVEEVVIFDDASQDATFELAVGVKAHRDLAKLRVIRHDRNLGYGGNQKAGYRYFIEKGFDGVVLLHGDGQYAPEILAHLYHPIVEGKADAVFGSRMMKTYGGPLRGGMPLYKFAGNKILTGIENRMLGLNLTEFHSGYRAYNLHTLKEIDFRHMTDDFHFDTEIIIKLHHQGFRIHEVPIPTYYGDEICYVNGVKYARDVLRAVRRYKQTCRSLVSAPEFSEYYVKYSIKRGRFSSHAYALRFAGSNQRVLDIGCGEGAFGAELARNGNTVTGIDQAGSGSTSPGATAVRVLRGDLDGPLEEVFDQIRNERFDRVLLLDVLEHLREPERLLALCHSLLKPGGLVVVSVPNIANITIRLLLLFGRFNYAGRGILDRTHLRFFTRRTARRMMEDARFEIVRSATTNVPLERILGFLSPSGIVMRGLDRVLAAATALFPGLLGYQVMFVARSRAGGSKV